MKIDFYVPGAWHDLNDEIARGLGIESSKTQLQVFNGLFQALFEATQGLVRLFPHKRKMVYFRNLNPFFEEPMRALSREGFEVQDLNYSHFKDLGWVESLAKDVLFVLAPYDDPMTGRIFESPSLLAKLEEKKIFLIRLSHGLHKVKDLTSTLSKFELRILSVDAQHSVVLAGERARFSSLMTSMMDWSKSSPQPIISELKPKQTDWSENQKSILEFEKNLSPELQSLLAGESDRIWDRAVVYNPSLNGEVVLARFLEQLGDQAKLDEGEAKLETLSSCRWPFGETFPWIKSQGFTPEQLRGSLIIDMSMLSAAHLNLLKKICQEELKLVQWN